MRYEVPSPLAQQGPMFPPYAPSSRSFQGNGSEYDSDDVDYNSSSCECFHIDGDNPADDAPELTPSNQSPCSRAEYLRENSARLQARYVNLEATEAELQQQKGGACTSAGRAASR